MKDYQVHWQELHYYCNANASERHQNQRLTKLIETSMPVSVVDVDERLVAEQSATAAATH